MTATEDNGELVAFSLPSETGGARGHGAGVPQLKSKSGGKTTTTAAAQSANTGR